MMPKMTFDEVIERSEKLGNKKNVQVSFFVNREVGIHVIKLFSSIVLWISLLLNFRRSSKV